MPPARAVATPETPRPVGCAIYTRKSTEEGLEQEFNSLDAQRECAEAQGEERDIIYYSMVANANNDRLWGVFIKNLASIDLEEDGQIKAQRLNVGFSRAKECVHFVISKPLDAFNGAVGEALRHFWGAHEDARKERTAADVDQKSAREAEVLNWFYQTEFWKAERERIEFISQFEIGKYLKQLDPCYTHPLYRVDFLLTYRPNADREQKIVIE